MEIRMVAVGRIKDRNLANLKEEYITKIGHDARLEFIEVKDSGKEQESKRLAELMTREEGSLKIILSEEGKTYSSKAFSDVLKKAGLESKKITFIIGGPFGISDESKKYADIVLSLSDMTMTHEFAQVFLLEQIYRALSIIKNRKYHKE